MGQIRRSGRCTSGPRSPPLAGQTPGRAREARLWVISDSGWLVHELRELRGAKNSPPRRRRLRIDQVVRHHGVDSTLLMRSLMARSMRSRPTRYCSPEARHRADRRLPSFDVVDLAAAVAQPTGSAGPPARLPCAGSERRRGSPAPGACSSSRGRPRTGRRLAVEEQALEHRLGGFHRRRLAGRMTR